jgi:hypothetical protein
VGPELYHAKGRADMTKLTVAFRNFANALENCLSTYTVYRVYECVCVYTVYVNATVLLPTLSVREHKKVL